jgi:sec-independent protein translocase protein TatA
MPGFIGMPELLLLGLVALLLFGPKKLPEMGRGLGKGLREFKESVSGDHKHEGGFDESKLELPQELTATPIGPEPLTTEAGSVETEKAA